VENEKQTNENAEFGADRCMDKNIIEEKTLTVINLDRCCQILILGLYCWE
jgi:hypothetical protein